MDKQFDNGRGKRALELLEQMPWGDIEMNISDTKDALRRLVGATSAVADRWDEEFFDSYGDEFSVPDETVTAMTETELLAYIARLVRSLALAYGVDAGLSNRQLRQTDNPDSPAALLQGLTNLA